MNPAQHIAEAESCIHQARNADKVKLAAFYLKDAELHIELAKLKAQLVEPGTPVDDGSVELESPREPVFKQTIDTLREHRNELLSTRTRLHAENAQLLDRLREANNRADSLTRALDVERRSGLEFRFDRAQQAKLRNFLSIPPLTGNRRDIGGLIFEHSTADQLIIRQDSK